MVDTSCMFYEEVCGDSYCTALTDLECDGCRFRKDKTDSNNTSVNKQLSYSRYNKDCMFFDGESTQCRALRSCVCENCNFYKKGTYEDYLEQVKDCINEH